MSFLFSFFTTN